jgi:hypothetical protein
MVFYSKIELGMLKILNIVENNYYQWDLKGKVSFSEVINLVFREEKKPETRKISHFPEKKWPPVTRNDPPCLERTPATGKTHS